MRACSLYVAGGFAFQTTGRGGWVRLSPMRSKDRILFCLLRCHRAARRCSTLKISCCKTEQTGCFGHCSHLPGFGLRAEGPNSRVDERAARSPSTSKGVCLRSSCFQGYPGSAFLRLIFAVRPVCLSTCVTSFPGHECDAQNGRFKRFGPPSKKGTLVSVSTNLCVLFRTGSQRRLEDVISETDVAHSSENTPRLLVGSCT